MTHLSAQDIDPDKWDAIREDTASGSRSEEIEAAREEGIAPMPADLLTYRDEAVNLAIEIDMLTARREEIKDIFRKSLEAEGLKGYSIYGKVKARIKHGTRSTVDSKSLRETLPHIYAQFLRTTEYTSTTIS